MHKKSYPGYVRHAFIVALALLLAWGAALAEERQAVVLMYHQFGVAQYPSTSVRLAQFDAHLEYLAEAGYQVWPLEKVVEYLRERKPFPARVVAITVDDAYLSVYTEAYPRLRARGWPFTVFVATDGVDRRFQALMSWEQMREMGRFGASFANHSATHDYLARRKKGETEAQWAVRVREDIERGQRRLQEELGSSSTLFAYPYGEYDAALADMVQAMGYSVAFGQHSGAAGLTDDVRALPRYPMAEAYAGMDDFRAKVASLAFPIKKVTPWDPVQARGHAPRLELALGESSARLDQLACFDAQGTPLPVAWLDRGARRFAVQAKGELPLGRSRYNCTAPAPEAGRYFWYSHPWLSY